MIVYNNSDPYPLHERAKKREYNHIEHDTFTPLVISATGGMGKAIGYHIL